MREHVGSVSLASCTSIGVGSETQIQLPPEECAWRLGWVRGGRARPRPQLSDVPLFFPQDWPRQGPVSPPTCLEISGS